MIERYSRNEIVKIWEEKNKYYIWLSIELAATQAMEKLKFIPRGTTLKIKKNTNFKKLSQSNIALNRIRFQKFPTSVF